MSRLSRRQIVFAGMATAAATALAACAPASPPTAVPPTAAPKPTAAPAVAPTSAPAVALATAPAAPAKPTDVPKPTAALAVVTTAPAAASKPAASSGNILNLALVPSENAAEQARQFGDFFKWMEKKLDLTIKSYLATDYTGVIEAMRGKHVDVAWFGPFSYVLAAQEAGAEALVIPASATGDKTYFSYIITRVDTGINKLEDLKGKSFSFGDPASASGHLIPRYNLQKAGIMPDKDFKSVVFSGAHDATGLAIANGKVDAGAIWDLAYIRLIEQKLIDETKMKIVAKSDPIPEGPWAVRKDVNADLKKRFTDTLLVAGTEVPDLLKPIKYAKFVSVLDSDYDVMRETAKILNLDIKKLK